MIFQVELHPLAQQELHDSYQWYEERSSGLGKRFLAAIEERINDIAEHPESFNKKTGNFRQATVDSFPFIIIYEILTRQKIVFVSYIFHTKRNPGLRYKR